MINVTAGDTIHSTTTNYFSNSPVSLTAADVDIDGKHNSSHVVQTHEEKRSGLTVSVGGQVVSALNTAQQLSKLTVEKLVCYLHLNMVKQPIA